MKLFIFGLGDYYSKYKRWIKGEYIVGLLDNDIDKQGSLIDGYRVYAPNEIDGFQYDLIVILSVHEPQMRKQLQELGVSEEKIIGSSGLVDHKEILNEGVPVELYASESDMGRLIQRATDNTILMMSPNLDFNGATMVLLYAAEMLCKIGYRIVFASWHDGGVRSRLESLQIPVIIDQNLELGTEADIPWVEKFSYIICNTIHYYLFLTQRTGQGKIIWWLHDPPCFYDSIDTLRLQSIDFKNVIVCAAGMLAADAFKNHNPGIDVKILPYGLPDINTSEWKGRKATDNKDCLTALVIANVQEYKGQDIIIGAVEGLAEEERKRIVIRIIGNDNSAYARELKNRAASLGGCVEFLSFMVRDSIEDEFSEADLLICASREDVMPISVCEAMQRCLPCIVPDSVGNSQYITDGYNGLVFKNEDIAGLTEKIRWCLSHRNILGQMGERSRRIYEDYFSMEILERNLKSLTDEIFK